MAKLEPIVINLELKDAQGTQSLVNKLKSSFTGLAKELSGDTSSAIKAIKAELDKAGKQTRTSTSAIKAQITALKGLQGEAQIGGKVYKELATEISGLERKLKLFVETSSASNEARKREIRTRINNLRKIKQEKEAIEAKNQAVRDEIAIQKSIARQQRKRPPLSTEIFRTQQPREISGLYQGIGEIGMSRINKDIDMMGNSYQQVAQDIRAATRASNNSINSLQAQAASWKRIRNNLDPASAAYREATREIDAVNRKLDKAQGRPRGGYGQGARATQIAGAVISGGIFGGPEGALGGLGGAALGGVSGAFAGAAIGAQVGGLRRQLGEFADYAAEIKRLEIALKGITEVQDDAVASQANYSRAVAAAADVTKNLNVPQEGAIRGITRLTAAVKGAGGGVADAELAFKNITSAITATGGGAEQVQGAVTALVQIFSKGKVSAEEINQIAERLPGTFNKIAEASGRTGPELTKALQKGEVGLNDLMKFLVQLGGEYGELAEKIAGSSEAAGQRLQVAYNNMRIEIGNALQPIGAEFQDAFTEFIRDITPTLVAVLPKIGEFFLLLAKNIDTVVVAMTGALAVFAVGKIAAIVASIGSLSAAFFTLKLNAIVATKALIGLNGAALLNPYTALAAGVAAFATNLFLAAREQKRLNTLIREGSVADVQSQISALRAEQAALEPKVYTPGPGVTQLDLRYEADASRLREIRETLPRLEERLRTARIDATQGADLSDFLLSGQLTQFSTKPEKGKDTVKNNFADALKQAQGLELRTAKTLELARAQSGIGRVLAQQANARKTLEAQIGAILKKNSDQKVIDATTAAESNLKEAQRLQLNQQIEAIIERSQEPLQSVIDGINQKLKSEREYAALIKTGVNPEIAQQVVQINRVYDASLKNLELKIQEFELLKSQGPLREEEVKLLDRLIQQRKELRGKKEEATTLALGMPAKENTKLKDFIKQSKDQLKDLQQVAVNVSQGIGNAVGNSLASGIEGLVAGTAKAKEVFANFLKDVGRVLIQEGAKMIATYIAIGVAKAFAGLLGGAPDAGDAMGGGGSLPLIANPGESVSMNAAGGLVFNANGGPVKSGRPYVVGERGPELFVPGATGRIDTNRDLSQMMGRSPVASSGPSMNFTFETTTIGGTEFVSREQLEDAMSMTRRQAAADGAKRGMGMTLDKIQNSPRTRSRIGIR